MSVVVLFALLYSRIWEKKIKQTKKYEIFSV